VATAQAVWPRFHDVCGVVQSEDEKVLMLSANAATELPRVNIPRIEGERVKPTSSTPRAMLTGSALDPNSLLEIGILVAGRLVEDKTDLLTLLTIGTRVLSPRHFIIVSPFEFT